MTLYGGARRDEEIPVDVRRLACGAGETACIECDGSGVWTVLPDDDRPVTCTTCKGTGKILIGV
jgi:hypothetical protein